MFTRRIDSAPSTTAATPAPPSRPPAPPTEAIGATATASAMPRDNEAIPGEHIVVFAPDVTRDQQVELLASLAPRKLEELPLVNGMLVTMDPARPPSIVGLDSFDRSRILFTQPNFRQHLRGGEGTPVFDASPATEAASGATTNDPEYAKQYHLENSGQTGGAAGSDIKANAAWKTSTGKGVIVALADTNIDIEHPDIAPNVWTNAGEVAGDGKDNDGNGFIDDVHGWNFGKNSNRPQDGGQTHGTHTAGIIAAAQNNGVGGSGVAPDVTLMPLAILTSNATTANAIKAFGYAVRNGANVISNSWGNNVYEPALAEAVRQTVAAGVSVVVAAGNENWDTGVNGSYPDNYAGSFSVAASDAKDAKASYSNRGTLTIDVAAPGDKIHSTLPGGKYGGMSGTSMAAPVVSGLLALVKARFPHLSMKEVEERVARSVQRDGAAKVWNTLVASGGRVDADAALTPLAQPGAPVPTDGAVAGSPVRIDWSSDLLEGQRFQVEVSANANAKSAVAEDFDAGSAARAFRSSGDKEWSINDAIARTGSKSFNVDGLGSGQQSRLELTETITEPTEISFAYTGGKSGELSFFINRDLQFKPANGGSWQDFTTTLQPGTYTFTWLAAGKGGKQGSPVAVDQLRIGSVSDAAWTPVGTTEPGTTGTFWTPPAATEAAAVRVRPDNGRFQGDWVQGESFPVVAKQGG
ncbi:MAG: peptidase and in, kexin, sedolisin [Thermoleophilia bacterium]|nr:peptidase and in, kexin, sedolisin [Thermoleophilia bacterium]